MKKTLILALAMTGLTLVGCAEEEAATPEPILDEAEVVTEPADDMMMEEDSTMMMDDPMMADSTMMEEGTMREETDGGAM